MKALIFGLFLLQLNLAWSFDCAQYLEVLEIPKSLKTKIQNIQTKVPIKEKDFKIITSLLKQKKYNKVISKLPSENIEKLFENLRDNEIIYQSFDKVSKNKILIDMIEPGYSARSYKRLKNYKRKADKYTWTGPKFKEGIQPTSTDLKYQKAFNAINDFFKDELKVFKHMQEFEDEIILRSYLKNPKFKSLSSVEKAKLKEAKMVEVLSESEIRHGFESNSSAKYEALELRNRTYTMKEWLAMLSEGKMFNDTNFKSALDNAAQVKEYLRKNHGYYTHRIQFHVLIKEMDKNPATFQKLKASQLLKKMGDYDYNRKLGLARDEDNTLWQKIFDVESSRSYHSPEFFREMHELYPEIGVWL